ncbi:MAG: serine acetyltransferase [Clostridiales bacterium]|jgi:serine O-acetyltransferase|nr:serine acetyltransferase [Clostridiales bacterium]
MGMTAMPAKSKNGHAEEIAELVAEIIESYERHSPASGLFPRFLPSKDVIIEIIESLRRIIFPGYFEKDDLDEAHLEYEIAALLIDVQKKLQLQICCALNHHMADGADCVDLHERAHELSHAFLRKIPQIREALLSDVEAAFDGDPAARDSHEIIFAYPGIFAITVYRLAHELHLLSVPLIPRIMTEHAHGLTGIDIHPGAQIGRRFFIDHGTGIVVGETTQIGDNVKIYQGVTLGALSTRGGQSLRGQKRHPTLGDEVTVYSSASILGGESVIGDGTVIGSNTFITRSVPAESRVSVKPPELNIRGNARAKQQLRPK